MRIKTFRSIGYVIYGLNLGLCFTWVINNKPTKIYPLIVGILLIIILIIKLISEDNKKSKN